MTIPKVRDVCSIRRKTVTKRDGTKETLLCVSLSTEVFLAGKGLRNVEALAASAGATLQGWITLILRDDIVGVVADDLGYWSRLNRVDLAVRILALAWGESCIWGCPYNHQCNASCGANCPRRVTTAIWLAPDSIREFWTQAKEWTTDEHLTEGDVKDIMNSCRAALKGDGKRVYQIARRVNQAWEAEA